MDLVPTLPEARVLKSTGNLRYDFAIEHSSGDYGITHLNPDRLRFLLANL